MNNENLESKVTIIPPFKRFCMTIGELPSSYTESMTYYESLVWLCNYIGNTLIPAINNNGEAVTELQEKYVELKDYVDNYFENLDIQTEINNKLDDMAEQGELTEIIAAYLELCSILGFDTKADLKAATNLISGSFAKTLGDTTYSTGDGHLYKIRDLEEGETIDDDELVGLTNYPALVAEKIPEYYYNTLDSRLDTLEDTTIPAIEAEIEQLTYNKVLIIGDSFIAQYSSSNWATKLRDLLGLTSDDVTILGEGGAGVYNVGNQGTNFLGLLQNNISSITDKDKYSKIIIGGGANDSNASALSDILTPLESLINYCKTQFPNAKIYFSAFGWCMKYDSVLMRTRINSIVIPAYKQASRFGAYYLSNTEFCYRDTSLYDVNDPVTSSMVHPNDDGQREIAMAIYEALNTGYTPRYKSSNIAFGTSDDVSAASCYFTHTLTPFNHTVNMAGNFTASKTYNPANGLTVDLGVINDPFMRKCTSIVNYFGHMSGRMYDTSNNLYNIIMLFSYDNNGHVKMEIPRGQTASSVSVASIVVNDTVYFDRYVW